MKYRIFLFILLTFFGFLFTQQIVNPDQPEKGEWSFSPQKAWETDHADTDILVNIIAIRIDQQGKIFILNSKLNRVHVFNSLGKFLFSFARKGEGPGEIKQAWGLFVIENRVIIPDTNKIHYFSKEGKYIESLPTPTMSLSYLFLDQHRVVAIPFYSFQKEQREVVLYDLKEESKKLLFRIPKVKALRYSGENIRLMLRMPFEAAEELLMVKRAEEIWYGYNNTYRIQRLSLNPKDSMSFSIQGRGRKEISRKNKHALFERVADNNSQLPNNVLNALSNQIPDQMPYFHYLFTDRLGRFLVLRASPVKSNSRNVDVFSSMGKYLYRGSIRIDPEYSILQLALRNGNLVVFVEDLDGERKLVKYTLNMPDSKS